MEVGSRSKTDTPRQLTWQQLTYIVELDQHAGS